MSKYAVMPLSDYDNACDKIREKTETAEPIKSGEFAGKVEDVYNEGLAEGIEQGKIAERNAFWSGLQKQGNRNFYRYAFYSQDSDSWNDETYNPIYPIVCSGDDSASSMFQNAEITDTKVDITIMGDNSYTFLGCDKLETVKKLIVSETTTYNRWFDSCPGLKNITFEGVIAKNGLNLQWSTKLSKASWQNIIGCLSAYTSGLSMTGSLASINKAFETSEGANDGSTSTEWLNLIATKSNWTIKLV